MEEKGTGRKRQRRRTKQERREIVEETLKAGASVAVIARAHGVNANQVFAWRKLYREGQLEEEASEAGALIPVTVSEPARATSRRSAVRNRGRGTIDIDLGHARVRIEGRADPACVRAALEGLTR